MSRVIPSKLVAMQKAVGVDSLKEIKPEKIRLHPVRGAGTTYSPEDRVSFRVPAYGNSMLDTSQTFLSFKIKTNNNGAAISGTTKLPVFGMGAPVFSRMTVKSAAGLVLEDITEFDVLRRLLVLINAEPTYRRDEGVFFGADPTDPVGVVLASGWDVNMRLDTGLLSRHLGSYLPLFMMDGGAGYALDIELTVNTGKRTLQLTAEPDTPFTKADFTLSNVALNLSLLRMDESLCQKFNSIACDPNEEIRIPFTTVRSHKTNISTQSSTTRVHETCSALKRIWAVLTNPSEDVTTMTNLRFAGANGVTKGEMESYNYKVGSQFVYNEPVACTDSGAETVAHIRNALWMDAHTPPALAAQSTNAYTYLSDASKGAFMTVASFDYSAEASQGVIQGISSSTPIEYSMALTESPPTGGWDLNLFAECAFDLVIRRGQVTTEECKPGSNVVY
jgi:hypothetical protein